MSKLLMPRTTGSGPGLEPWQAGRPTLFPDALAEQLLKAGLATEIDPSEVVGKPAKVERRKPVPVYKPVKADEGDEGRDSRVGPKPIPPPAPRARRASA